MHELHTHFVGIDELKTMQDLAKSPLLLLSEEASDFVEEDRVVGESEWLIKMAIMQNLIAEKVMIQFILYINLSELLEVDQPQRIKHCLLMTTCFIVANEHIG